MANGYAPQILRVDLTAQRTWTEPLPGADVLRKYVGGTALALYYLAKETPRSAKSGDPDVPLIFMTGPLADRTVRDALEHLAELDPLAAFFGRAARLTALATSPGTSVRQFQNEISALSDIASGLGEPGLAVDLGKLLARERGDCAPLVKAVHAVLGR